MKKEKKKKGGEYDASILYCFGGTWEAKQIK